MPKTVVLAEITLNSKNIPGKSQEAFITVMVFRNLEKKNKVMGLSGAGEERRKEQEERKQEEGWRLQIAGWRKKQEARGKKQREKKQIIVRLLRTSQ